MSSVVLLEDARVRNIALPADDDAAQDVLDEMEAWLASRIGPLVGERTETFLNPPVSPLFSLRYASSATLRLRRPTDDIDVSDAEITVTAVELRDQRYVINTDGYWTGPVEVTSTPNDELLIRGVLFDLLRLAPTETGYQSETIGAYSYSRGTNAPGLTSRWSLIRRLLPGGTFDSVQVRSEFDRPFPPYIVTADSVSWSGS